MSPTEPYVCGVPDSETIEFLMLGTGWQEGVRQREKPGLRGVLWVGSTALTKEEWEALLYADWAKPISCGLARRDDSAGVTAQIETALRWLESSQVVVPSPAEVRDYLLRYPDMTALLVSVSELARETFGTDAQLSAEVYHDPEVEDEYLTLYVRQDTYDDHVLDMIDEIRVQYESALIGKSGWLLVTTDFQPPE